MYKVGDLVKIIDTGEIKQISDFETVYDVELFYMSDKTSYPVDRIFPVDKSDSIIHVNEVIDNNSGDNTKTSKIRTLVSNGLNWVLNKLGVKPSTEFISDEIVGYDPPLTPEETLHYEKIQENLNDIIPIMSKEEIDDVIQLLSSNPIKYDPRMLP